MMGKISLYNLYIYTVLGIGGFNYGFGFSVFVTAQGQPGFYNYFDLEPGSVRAARIIDVVNSLFTAGAAFGALTQSPAADRWGRKIALAIAAVFVTIGSALAAGSVNIPMLVCVRILQGFGLGMILPLVPLYLTEVAPASHRGLTTGVTVLGFGMGYFVCSWTAVGTYYSNETVQWRVPLAVACVPALLLLAALPTIPETPRYLTWAGRKAEAWDVLRRLHHNPNDADDRAAHAEYTQIVMQVEHDKEENVGYMKILKKPSLRRRAILSMFLLFAVSATGIIGITNFLPVIFMGLGLGGVMPLVMYGIWTAVGTSAVIVTIFIVDKLGRRRFMLIGYPTLAVLLLAQAVLQNRYVGTEDDGGLAACLLFLLLFVIMFQGVDAPSFIWASEVWPTSYRAKGISLAFFSFFIGSLTFTTPSGLAFKTIGWRMYLFYMAMNIICGTIIYFFIKETKGLPMEELAGLFGDEVVVHLTEDGTGIREDPTLDKVASLGIEGEVHHIETEETGKRE